MLNWRANFRFNVRDLFLLAAVIGLSLALYLTRVENSRMKRHLSGLPRCLVQIMHPQLHDRYSIYADVAVWGRLDLPNPQLLQGEPRVHVSLTAPLTGMMLYEFNTYVTQDEDSMTFGGTLKNPTRNSPNEVLPEGFYPMITDVRDDNGLVGRTITLIEFVNTRK